MARIVDMHKSWLKEPKYKKAYDALEEEFACLAEGPESYWQTRSALPWS